jgi:hypothetical protein
MKDSSKNPKPLSSDAAPTAGKPARVAKPERGKLVAKKNTASGNNWGTKANKTHSVVRSGAKYGVTAKMSGGNAPEAGKTLANGIIIPPSVNRTRSNFSAGSAEAHAR